MKQIYASILLTVLTTLSTSCMEKEVTNNIQEKKSLLQTNDLVQPNQEHLKKERLKKELYTAATELRYGFDPSKITIHYKLINFITLMNNAKRHGITEHDTARYTYAQNTTYTPITLYFHCLQKYNDAKEELPFTIDELNDEFCLDTKFAQACKISYTYHSMQDIENKLKAYPAYTHLIDKLKTADQYPRITNDHWALCVSLHSGTKILFNGYPEYNDVTNFDGFYAKAYEMLRNHGVTIYNLITLVERIKKIEEENDEIYFISKILNYQRPITTFLGFEYNSGEKYSDCTWSKKQMAFMYKRIEQYNRDRGNKKNPTAKQLQAFLSYKKLDIPLPDNFDKAVFDENKYAFEEFQTLGDSIITIKYASREVLEQAIKKILQEK